MKYEIQGNKQLYDKSMFFAFLSVFFVSEGLFFHDVKIETFSSGKSDFWLFVPNDENISFSSGEGFSIGVSQMDNIEWTQMSFNVKDGSGSTNIVTTNNVG